MPDYPTDDPGPPTAATPPALSETSAAHTTPQTEQIAAQVAEDEAQTAAETASEAAETAEDTQAEGEGAENAETTARPAKNGVAQRFSEMTAQRRAAEARAAEAETRATEAAARLAEAQQRLAELSQAPKQDADPNPRPQRANFDNPDAYEDALIEWSTAKAASKIPQQQAQADAQRAQQQHEAATRAAWQERSARVAEEHPDFQEVVFNPSLAVTPAMTTAMLNTDNGPAIAYHLGKNLAEAARISALPPPKQFTEIARLSVRLEAPPPVSKAPPPIKPVGSRASGAQKDPNLMTTAEYEAYRTQQNGGRPVR
jgi:hypothetical protein